MKMTTPTMAMVVILALEIGGGAFAHGGGNFLHAGRARIGGEKAARRDDAVDDGQRAREHDQPESGGHELTLLFVLPRCNPDTRILAVSVPCPGLMAGICQIGQKEAMGSIA